jgi:hypothetical protein
MKRPDIEFSEIAIKGLEKCYPDAEKRITAFHSIEWYVKREDTLEKSRACPAFDDMEMFIFPLHDMRILFERNGLVKVWSILKEVVEYL